jgi:hypothetical protein
MCEFRMCEKPRRWAFLELNGRFWGSLPLSLAAGADFPRFLYDMHCHGRTEFPAGYHIGVRSRDLRPDLRWTWRALRGRIGDAADQAAGWQINPATRGQVSLDVMRMVACRDRIDTFALDDPLPFLSELKQLVRSSAGKFRRREQTLCGHRQQLGAEPLVTSNQAPANLPGNEWSPSSAALS